MEEATGLQTVEATGKASRLGTWGKMVGVVGFENGKNGKKD